MTTPLKPHLPGTLVDAGRPSGGAAERAAASVAENGRLRAKKNNQAFLWRIAVGGLAGAGVGYAYYYFVGCTSGHCLIGANPFLSAIFGGLFGLMISALAFPVKR